MRRRVYSSVVLVVALGLFACQRAGGGPKGSAGKIRDSKETTGKIAQRPIDTAEKKKKGITPKEYVADRPTGKYDDKVVTVTGPFWLSAKDSDETHYAFRISLTINIYQRRDSIEGKQLFEILKDVADRELTVDLSARGTDGALLPWNYARVVKVH